MWCTCGVSAFKDSCADSLKSLVGGGVPKGIRTPVAAVKGRCPRPLDDGDQDSLLFSHCLHKKQGKSSIIYRVNRYALIRMLPFSLSPQPINVTCTYSTGMIPPWPCV